MAKPITWRTIAGPSFNNSALATAVGAFDRAGSGFGEVSDRLFQTQDRIDKQYTNDAVKQALATGQVDPSLNPRADSAAVYEALLGKQKFESDIQTADVNRKKLRADTKYTLENTERLAFENTPEWRRLLKDEKLAQIEKQQADAKNAAERNRLEALRISILESENDRAEELRTNIRGAEDRFAADVTAATEPLVAEQTDQARQSIGGQIAAEVERMIGAGESPETINAAVRRMSSEAGTKFQGIDDLSRVLAREQVLNNYANNPATASELGLLPEDFARTTAGAEIKLGQETAAQAELARQERQAELDLYQLGAASDAAVGNNTTGVIYDPESPDGFRLARDKGEASGNKLSNIGQWNAEIEKAGLTKELEDVSKQVFDYTRGNKSILQNILKLPGLTKEGFVEQAQILQDDLQNYAADTRVAALRQEDPYTLTGVQERLARETADSRFLGEPSAAPDRITFTNDPQIKSQAVTALNEIQRLRDARPNMDPRQRRLLDRFESIFTRGSYEDINGAFSSRNATKTFDDKEVIEKINEWNLYQQRNGYK